MNVPGSAIAELAEQGVIDAGDLTSVVGADDTATTVPSAGDRGRDRVARSKSEANDGAGSIGHNQMHHQRHPECQDAGQPSIGDEHRHLFSQRYEWPWKSRLKSSRGAGGRARRTCLEAPAGALLGTTGRGAGAGIVGPQARVLSGVTITPSRAKVISGNLELPPDDNDTPVWSGGRWASWFGRAECHMLLK